MFCEICQVKLSLVFLFRIHTPSSFTDSNLSTTQMILTYDPLICQSSGHLTRTLLVELVICPM